MIEQDGPVRDKGGVAGRREVDENMFNQIKEKYYGNKAD